MKNINSKEVSVLVSGPFNEPFDYVLEDKNTNISVGQIVLVPFGKRKIVGIIIGDGTKTIPETKLKTILKVYDFEPIPKPSIELMNFLSSWYCVFKGLVLKMILSPIEAITSPDYEKVYKSNFLNENEINEIKEIKITNKRKLVLDFLLNLDIGKSQNDIIKQTGVSKAILKDMTKKKLVQETKVYKTLNLDSHFLKNTKANKKNYDFLNLEQKFAVDRINDSIIKKKSDCFLLDGVPGSGKTETYFETVRTCLDQGRQSLILLPEIVLTPDWEKRFFQKFSFAPLVWNSEITKKKKKKIWLSALNGTAGVVVGARSALMLPISNLGLIVVDEEHEQAFKQEENVRYNARDMAIYRSSRSSAPIVLASATPSLETFYNAKNGKYIHLTLPKRATGATLPNIKIIDLIAHPPGKGKWLSPLLVGEIESKLNNKEQSLLFLNRRGYAPLSICNSCGDKIKCINCDSWLVEHRSKNILICHHCGYSRVFENFCKKCGVEGQIKACGPGVERIEEEIKE